MTTYTEQNQIIISTESDVYLDENTEENINNTNNTNTEYIYDIIKCIFLFILITILLSLSIYILINEVS